MFSTTQSGKEYQRLAATVVPILKPVFTFAHMFCPVLAPASMHMFLVYLQSKKSVKEADNVRVVVRCRPLNEKEVANGNQMAVKVNMPHVLVKYLG